MGAMPNFTEGQVMTIFRSRLSDDAGAAAEYHETAEVISKLAEAQPGFVDYKTFAADDGERVTVVTFADAESQRDWRKQADHAAAQQAGRDRFYSQYSIQVGTCTRVSQFTAPE